MLEAKLYTPFCNGASKGWHLFKSAGGSSGQKPDNIAGADPTGRVVAIEVKVLRRPLDEYDLILWAEFSAHQMSWLREIVEAGDLSLVKLYDETTGRISLHRVRDHEDCPGPAHDV